MTPAIQALVAARIPHQVLEYRPAPDANSYGLDAARALGLPPEQIFKTLISRLDDGRLAVALVPVHRSLDLKALATALRAKRAALADVAEAERATGYVAGGISPLGQRKRLPTVVDASMLALDAVHVSAGRRGLQLKLKPADLVALCAASTAELAR